MLLDVIAQDSYQSYNVKIAHIIGLTEAVYVKLIVDIYSKAMKKNKISHDFITIDRNYVQFRTTLTPEQQYKLDNKLSKISLISVSELNRDDIKFNLNLYASLLGCEDLEQTISELKKKKTRATKDSKSKAIVNNLKKSLDVDNDELRAAYENWIDEVALKFGYLSKTNIDSFKQELNEFSKGDLDVALGVLKVAANLCYRECSWAIDVYKKNNNHGQYTNTAVRTTIQKRASADTISDEVF